ncbi:YdgH/BhsA/McbA-like domain containing protein [Arsenophonus apicola]|nr:YdgH/BhsA/McbA-like domain containing protein [Arsenophonus apicola]UBX29400.1 DUF1471 domain-containing protein [Arsenophonus apicola]
MKKLPAALILVLGTLSFGAMADQAKEVIETPAQQSIGIVSVAAGETPTSAVQQLAEEATKKGATIYRVTFLAYTQNKVQANARIYGNSQTTAPVYR